VIRNVVIHVTNEQPLLADLYQLPVAADAGLVCTNVRGLDGKRPVFIDQIGSTFFFPYHVIRFLEIPAGAARAQGVGSDAGTRAPAAPGSDPAADAPPGGELAIAVGAGGDATPEEDLDVDIEIDEGFLQRIRDI
jgi:hypothetical protein